MTGVSPRQRMLVERAIGYLIADNRHDVAMVVEELLQQASEPPAWVEQLTADLETMAGEREKAAAQAHRDVTAGHGDYCTGESAGLLFAAAELIKRAKGGERG